VLRAAVGTARVVLAPALTVSNLGRVPAGLAVGPDGPRVVAMYFLGTAGPPQGLMICLTRGEKSLHITFGHHLAVLDHAGVVAFAQVFREAMDDVLSGLLSGRGPTS
jgi:hypothetical protein